MSTKCYSGLLGLLSRFNPMIDVCSEYVKTKAFRRIKLSFWIPVVVGYYEKIGLIPEPLFCNTNGKRSSKPKIMVFALAGKLFILGLHEIIVTTLQGIQKKALSRLHKYNNANSIQSDDTPCFGLELCKNTVNKIPLIVSIRLWP